MPAIIQPSKKKDESKTEAEEPKVIITPPPAASAAPSTAPKVVVPPPAPKVDAALMQQLSDLVNDAEAMVKLDLKPGDDITNLATSKLEELRKFLFDARLTDEQRKVVGSAADKLSERLSAAEKAEKDAIEAKAKAEAEAQAKAEAAEEARKAAEAEAARKALENSQTSLHPVTLSVFQILEQAKVGKSLSKWAKDKSDDVLQKMKTDIGHATGTSDAENRMRQNMVAAIDKELRSREAEKQETLAAPPAAPPQQPPAQAQPPAPQPTPPPAPPQTPPQATPPRQPGQATMMQQGIATGQRSNGLLAAAVGIGCVLLGLVFFGGVAYVTMSHGWHLPTITLPTFPTPSSVPDAPTAPVVEPGPTEVTFSCVPASEHGSCEAISLETSPQVEHAHLAGHLASAPHWDCRGLDATAFNSHIDGVTRTFNGCDVCRWCNPSD